MDSDEYIFPTTRSRMVIIFWLVLLFILYFITTRMFDELQINEENLAVINTQLIISCTAMFLLFLAISIWLFKLGIRIKNENRFPPSDFPVLFKTKISKGKLANIQTIATFTLSLFVLLFSVFYLYGAWISYDI